MGWEIRRGKRVYYRKVREGARVRSIYFAPGEAAETAAREDAERRLARRENAVQKTCQNVPEIVPDDSAQVTTEKEPCATPPTAVAHARIAYPKSSISPTIQRKIEETRRFIEWQKQHGKRR